MFNDTAGATAPEEKIITPYRMGNATRFDNGTITVDVHPRGRGCDDVIDPIKAVLAGTIETADGPQKLSHYASVRYRNNLGHGWVETTFQTDKLHKAGGSVQEVAQKIDAAVAHVGLDGTFVDAVTNAVPEIKIAPSVDR